MDIPSIIGRLLCRLGFHDFKVVEATLGDDAVILGAVALARGFGRETPVEAGEAPLPKYPKIDYIGPGEAAIASKLYSQDVYVRGDGKVRRRRVDIAREAFGTVHKIGIAELERVCKGRPEHLVICMGRSGRLTLEKEGAQFLRERRVSWELLRAADAVKAFNRLKGRKAAIIHVAC